MTEKKVCDECGNPCRKFHFYQDKLLCWKCYHKKMHFLGGVPLDKALKKVYTVKEHKMKRGKYFCGTANFPGVLIGARFKRILVEVQNL